MPGGGISPRPLVASQADQMAERLGLVTLSVTGAWSFEEARAGAA